MTDPRKPIFDAVRERARAGLFNDAGNILALDNLLDAFNVPRAGQVAKPSSSAAVGQAKTPAASAPVSSAAKEPAWLREARTLIGLREIPGPKHNAWIASSWKRLGGWHYKDDETPWCGLFVAHCIEHAGLPFPKLYPSAKAWADWGQACAATVGAVVVFGRQGGGHVGFLVGESALNYYVLGGNQSNAVNITPIAKSRMLAIRWPDGVAKPHPGLPKMAGGTVSVNEA
jgi:uncharacterized protein (TIGR02594 family)